MSVDPVLLLHGQPGGARDWDGLVAALGEQLPAIALYRPGWDGASRAGGIAGSARAAIAALDAAGVQRATVVGHSFGGAVAAWIAAEHPERVSALVLVAPSASVDSLVASDRWLARRRAGYAVSAALMAGVGVTLGWGPARRRIATRVHVDQDYLRVAGRRLRQPSAWRAFNVEQQALVDELPRLDAKLEWITAPTTIVIGTADPIVPPQSARALARRIRGAALVELEHAGHLLPHQHGARLAEIVLAAARSDRLTA